jgi:hypothetical protein
MSEDKLFKGLVIATAGGLVIKVIKTIKGIRSAASQTKEMEALDNGEQN